MLQLVRILDDLPEDFEALAAEASGEGLRNIAQLAESWRGGVSFQDDGEALFAAFLAGTLAGIGGLSVETGATEPARRLSHVYVAPRFRRQGVATALASALIHEGLDSVGLLTVDAAGAAAFWETQGFTAYATGAWTHALRRNIPMS